MNNDLGIALGTLIILCGTGWTAYHTYKKGIEAEKSEQASIKQATDTNSAVKITKEIAQSSDIKIDALNFQNLELKQQNIHLQERIDNLRAENTSLYEKLQGKSIKMFDFASDANTYPRLTYYTHQGQNRLSVFLEVIGENSLSNVEVEHINLTDLEDFNRKGYPVNSDPTIQNRIREEFLSAKFNAPELSGGSFSNKSKTEVYSGPTIRLKSRDPLNTKIYKLKAIIRTKTNAFEQTTVLKSYMTTKSGFLWTVSYTIKDQTGKVLEEKNFPPPY